MKKIVIIDYGCGNLLSIERAIKKVGYNSIVSRDLNELRKATHIILPGVGAFGNAISLLKEYSLIEIIKKHTLKERKPLLGICLGMQLLFSSSDEFGFYNGLDIIEGKVERIIDQTNKKIKIQHIGWKTLELLEKKNLSIDENNSFYFTHSYMVNPENKEIIKAYTLFEEIKIPAIIIDKNITGFQFHPEKSSFLGLELIKTFCQSD